MLAHSQGQVGTAHVSTDITLITEPVDIYREDVPFLLRDLYALLASLSFPSSSTLIACESHERTC